MCKLSLLLLLAVFGCLLVSGSQAGRLGSRDANTNEVSLRDITVVKDVRAFAAKHPGLKMQRLTKHPEARSSTQSVRYSLGARISGDRLVAQGADVFSYPSVKDVSLQLTYPESGTGAVVTYVELICSQDNTEGNAYVVAGGIGQRFISIVLEANQTKNFSYQAQYYGTD